MVIIHPGTMGLLNFDTSSDEGERFISKNFLWLMNQYGSSISKQPIRNASETGVDFMRKVLNGHPDRCYDLFRMEKHVFQNLCQALKSRSLLKDSKFVPVEEQVAIFLMTIGHSVRNRMVAD
eukprot:TRINITY_DN14278_c0_g1_i3.p1 TRINITY_DN14278_c0_g1~~TRINITY_DN14278_c0_g1_i3.p1  ORF type:complete len:122 (+),score=4.78 TRINITY_DN14278_c0_g1_i3:2296-2661(+)